MVCVCALFSLTGCYNTEPRENVLKIYNWADYIDEDVLAEFPRWYKEQTGEDIRIVYQTFDINEIMLTKIERGHEDFDVVCPSEYIIERMLRKGLLLPIDTVFGKTPNYLHNESPYIREQLDKLSRSGHRASDYAIGYMWGTAGILFNTDHVPAEDARTWASLWNLKYENKILMKESYRDAYGTALIYANTEDLKKGKVTVEELKNNYSQASIDTVEKYLKAMKPLIGKWCTTTRTVRNDFKSFVQEFLVPDFFQCPPFRLDIIIMVSNIWIFHICPETYCRREIFPHSFVFPDTFFTFIDKWFYTIFFNLIFSVKTEQLFYFQLYRQSVSIPSCLTRNHVALHCTVSRDHIFDYTGKNVSDMRFSICCRRSIVESISFSFFTVLHTFLENIFFIPEFFNFFFSVYKLQVCIHFFVLSHDKLLSESMTLYAFLGI